MSELVEEIEEVVIIQDFKQKLDQLIDDLMTGKKLLSFSSLKKFRDTPIDFVNYVLQKPEQTEAMFLGTVIHCLVLEPEKFDERYTVMDDTAKVAEIGGGNPRNTNLYKEWKANFLANVKGTVITIKIHEQAKAIANNIMFNRAAKKIISLCPEREKYIEWQYKNFGFRGYIDLNGQKLKADLKLVPDASPRKAQRTIIDRWIYGQAAMYLTEEGVKVPFYIIAFDRKGGVSVHKLDKSLIDHGLEEYETVVDKFNECLIKENFNQSYDFWAESWDGIFVCDKPAYMY